MRPKRIEIPALEPGFQRAVRISVGLTQGELGEILDLSHAAVSNSENGIRRLSRVHLQVLVKIHEWAQAQSDEAARYELGRDLVKLALAKGPAVAVAHLWGALQLKDGGS